jgi:DNA helicase-2/ATP-dependent DNA helicase PcrA
MALITSENSEGSESTPEQQDPELERIVGEEERCLSRVLTHLAERAQRKKQPESEFSDYDTQLLALRDEIATARLEDVPPLIEQMERLQTLAARRRGAADGFVDPRSPYFGRLVLQEGERRREVLIGRSTYLDAANGVRIVDWRDAPVSRLYYRYDEGEEYSEVFGDREVDGEVLTRRSVTIGDRVLRRIGTPQGSFARRPSGGWRRLDVDSAKLRGGQGSAIRAEQHHRPGKLGAGDELTNEDKHLKEITALIDARQFELITRPDSGLVVIQGGAGSGKTTIGLHRLAYLAFHDKRRFRADRMLVVVFNDALARYIGQVLPALGIEGVAIRTYEDWASRLRGVHVPRLPSRYSEDTPSEVTRLKKHPAMLRAIDDYVAKVEQQLDAQVQRALAHAAGEQSAQSILSSWQSSGGRPTAHRLHGLGHRVAEKRATLPTDARVALERIAADGLRHANDVVSHWAELCTDRAAITATLARHPTATFSEGELNRALSWCNAVAARVVNAVEEQLESEEQAESRVDKSEPKRRRESRPDRDRDRDRDREDDRHDVAYGNEGIDGRALEEGAVLDREDDTLLLRLYQRLVGPLRRGGKSKDGSAKEALVYEHVLIDEAQDLSPVELAVVLDTVSRSQSVTLAGDVAQRLHMDNGFTDWQTVLGELGLAHVEIEPLKVSYRSTHEIVDFARAVLGPLAPQEQPVAVRGGAPVECFTFADSGDAVAFLAENLRQLMHSEPRSSVAVIARYPEQADLYYRGLVRAEIPNLRRIAEQDFPFKPGIDVTDIRQVKGLEFDYVVLLEASHAAYPPEDEARHLLHIGATRAAHQLWVLTTTSPSPLLPAELLERGG